MIRKIFSCAVIAAALGVGATQAQAGLLDDWNLTGIVYTDSGSVAGNWNINTPRTETGVSDLGLGDMVWAEGNDTAEYFSTGTPYGGEFYDQEFLAWRVDGNQIRVLGITSTNPFTLNDSQYKIGDLFIDIDCDSHAQDGTAVGDGDDFQGYEFAVSTGVDWVSPGSHNPGGTAVSHVGIDGLYQIDDAGDVIGIRGSFAGSTAIRDRSNPWAISDDAVNIGGAGVTIETLTEVDGGKPNYAIEWVFNLADLPDLDLGQVTFHWAVECGNDWINTDKHPGEPVIPEPATVALLGLGLASAGLIRRRR